MENQEILRPVDVGGYLNSALRIDYGLTKGIETRRALCEVILWPFGRRRRSRTVRITLTRLDNYPFRQDNVFFVYLLISITRPKPVASI